MAFSLQALLLLEIFLLNLDGRRDLMHVKAVVFPAAVAELLPVLAHLTPLVGTRRNHLWLWWCHEFLLASSASLPAVVVVVIVIGRRRFAVGVIRIITVVLRIVGIIRIGPRLGVIRIVGVTVGVAETVAVRVRAGVVLIRRLIDALGTGTGLCHGVHEAHLLGLDTLQLQEVCRVLWVEVFLDTALDLGPVLHARTNTAVLAVNTTRLLQS